MRRKSKALLVLFSLLGSALLLVIALRLVAQFKASFRAPVKLESLTVTDEHYLDHAFSPGNGSGGDLIVVATVEKVKYFKWPNPKGFFYKMPNTSDTPMEGYAEYVYLSNVQVLWDKFAGIPAEFNHMKSGKPLWSEASQCFQNNSPHWPTASSMLGTARIFFLEPAVSASDNTQLVTACYSPSAPISNLVAIKDVISKRKPPDTTPRKMC